MGPPPSRARSGRARQPQRAVKRRRDIDRIPASGTKVVKVQRRPHFEAEAGADAPCAPSTSSDSACDDAIACD